MEKVGYKNPPIATRFVAGGENPNRINKPVGALSHKTIIRKFLEEQVTIKDIDNDGKEIERLLTMEEAIVLGQMRAAMRGNSKNYNAVMDRYMGKVPQRIENENRDVDEFSSEDDLAWLHEAQERAKIQFAERMISETEDVKDEAQNILDAK